MDRLKQMVGCIHQLLGQPLLVIYCTRSAVGDSLQGFSDRIGKMLIALSQKHTHLIQIQIAFSLTVDQNRAFSFDKVVLFGVNNRFQ